MKQVLSGQGRAFVAEVPAPGAQAGGVLVRVDHSAISAGTELSGLQAGGMPLWKRAMKKPYLLKRAWEYASANGLQRTRQMIREKGTASLPMGYSAAGAVAETGAGVAGFQPGDRVACAGAQCAYHAEWISVPVNLAAAVPEGVSFADASTVALGAIALQGIRRFEPTLGETIVVSGLGILGQLTVQMLRANGCRVIGIDPEPKRVELAERYGLSLGIDPQREDEVQAVERWTGGVGADGVIITAATPSDEVISRAFRMCRRKGRVVLVGDVGLNINRADMYEKELDFRISTSYGPGRYDANYEEEGQDYPPGYVRWTENRNMQAYLQMLADGRVKLGGLISAVFPVEQAAEAYQRIQSAGERPLMALIKYPPADEESGASETRRRIINPQAEGAGGGRVRIAVVGTGAFARGTHLPNLQALRERFSLQAVVAGRGHNAATAAMQYGAAYATTEFEQVLTDDHVDAVLICTRHDRHAEMTLAALNAGKHVLVEKPLALTAEELRRIEEFYQAPRAEPHFPSPPLLMTGFNRRFAPAVRRIAEITAGRTNPMIINYVMNAGYIPPEHWTQTAEGGGRNRGEACHIYDLLTFLTDSSPLAISAQHVVPRTAYYSSQDNFVVTARFVDGSVGNLVYTALGSPKFPKEQMQIFVDGGVIRLEDYREMSVTGRRGRGYRSRIPEKGHRQELVAFAEAIQGGGQWPIPLWQQVQATEVALAVEQQLNGGPDGWGGGESCAAW